MANPSFEYKLEANDLLIRIDGWEWGQEFRPINEVLVEYRELWHTSVCFYLDNKEMHEEDPFQHNEEGRNNLRNLLKLLGYRRLPVWTWTWTQGINGQSIG